VQRTLLVWLLLALSWGPAVTLAHDLVQDPFTQVGVDEKPGQPVPLTLGFRQADRPPVHLADYFTGQPVILTLNYYACPSLCPLVFKNLAATIDGLTDLKLSRDFRIVTVSINPAESPELARSKAATSYALLEGTSDPARRWPFLLGEAPEISRLAASVGVRYLRQGANDFAHPNVLVILTPDGRVSRYLYGLQIPPRDLRLALLEAAQGRIGSSPLSNRLLLYCFHYDPVGKKYVLFASRLMTLAMLTVLVLTAALLIWLYKRERRGNH